MQRAASPAASTAATLFLVERYWAGIDETRAREVVASLEATALAMSAEGEAIEHVASILMPADQVVFSLITAANEAAVRSLNQRADAPLDRIAVAIAFGIGPIKPIEAHSKKGDR